MLIFCCFFFASPSFIAVFSMAISLNLEIINNIPERVTPGFAKVGVAQKTAGALPLTMHWLFSTRVPVASELETLVSSKDCGDFSQPQRSVHI